MNNSMYRDDGGNYNSCPQPTIHKLELMAWEYYFYYEILTSIIGTIMGLFVGLIFIPVG